MRVIYSNIQDADVDKDTSDALNDDVFNAGAFSTLRESYINDEIGQKAVHFRLIEYTTPGTDETRWAVWIWDAEASHIEDTADQDEADASYEHEVLAYSESTFFTGDGTRQFDDGIPTGWDYSDVDNATMVNDGEPLPDNDDDEDVCPVCREGFETSDDRTEDDFGDDYHEECLASLEDDD